MLPDIGSKVFEFSSAIICFPYNLKKYTSCRNFIYFVSIRILKYLIWVCYHTLNSDFTPSLSICQKHYSFLIAWLIHPTICWSEVRTVFKERNISVKKPLKNEVSFKISIVLILRETFYFRICFIFLILKYFST